MNDKKGEENIFRTKILPEQEWEGEDYDFDPDSSPKAWDHYKIYYNNIFFEGDLLKVESGKEQDIQYYRLKSKAKASVNDINYIIAGDSSFNFNDIKAPNFKKMIEKDKRFTDTYIKKVKEDLKKCIAMHHTLLNFDLIPVTGGMNNIKGNLKYKDGKVMVNSSAIKNPIKKPMDRLDTFIYFLDYSFKRIDEFKKSKDVDLKAIGEFFSESVFTKSLGSENFVVLYDLLEKYGDIYEYCKVFYNIGDKKFVDRLVQNGKSPIITVIDIDNYMKLANEFWDIKEKYFMTLRDKR